MIADSMFCVGMAVAKDLPDVVVMAGDGDDAVVLERRRPVTEELSVYSFPQTWGSTALGFGGIGGAAMTEAQTTVVMYHHAAAVYFGRRLAYVIPDVELCFMTDLHSCDMADVRGSGKYRRKKKAVVPSADVLTLLAKTDKLDSNAG